MQDKEKARVGVATPATGHHQISQAEYATARNRLQGETLDATRLRHLARRLHALGERPLYELMRELVAGADPVARLEAYCRIDPAILAALGGVTLPAIMTSIDGGRR
jgi:hypothetical protein